ncbi:MAG: hypothetical protein ACQESE_05145 [Nanobdellota archaeon]
MSEHLSVWEAADLEPGDKAYMIDHEGQTHPFIVSEIEGHDENRQLSIKKILFAPILQYREKIQLSEVAIRPIDSNTTYSHENIRKTPNLKTKTIIKNILEAKDPSWLYEEILRELVPESGLFDLPLNEYKEWLILGGNHYSHFNIESAEEMFYQEMAKHSISYQHDKQNIPTLDTFYKYKSEEFSQKYRELKNTYQMVTHIEQNYPKEHYDNKNVPIKTIGDLSMKIFRNEIDKKTIDHFMNKNSFSQSPFKEALMMSRSDNKIYQGRFRNS